MESDNSAFCLFSHVLRRQGNNLDTHKAAAICCIRYLFNGSTNKGKAIRQSLAAEYSTNITSMCKE